MAPITTGVILSAADRNSQKGKPIEISWARPREKIKNKKNKLPTLDRITQRTEALLALLYCLQ